MHEDITVKTTLSFAAFFSYFAGLPAEVVMGSLMGAIYFITAATEYTLLRRSVLALVSFISGLLFFSPAAAMFIKVTKIFEIPPDAYSIDSIDAVGAFVSALLSVKLSIKAYRKADSPQGGNDV